MAYDIITIEPTISDGAHAIGDVLFNAVSFELPANTVKLVNIFAEVAAGGGEDNTKIGILFFQGPADRTNPTDLGTLNDSADISAANFTLNRFTGQAFIGLSDGSGNDLDVIDNTAIYYMMNASNSSTTARGTGASDPLILKGMGRDAAASTVSRQKNKCFAAGVIHAGTPDFDGTDNMKIHLHVEY
jgi:hypothetical protein